MLVVVFSLKQLYIKDALSSFYMYLFGNVGHPKTTTSGHCLFHMGTWV